MMIVKKGLVGAGLMLSSATSAFAEAAPADVQQMARCIYDNVLALDGSEGMVVSLDNTNQGIGYPEGQRVRRSTELLFGLQSNAPGVDIAIAPMHGEQEGSIFVQVNSEKTGYFGDHSGTAYAVITADGSLQDIDGNSTQGLITTGQGISLGNFDMVNVTSHCIAQTVQERTPTP